MFASHIGGEMLLTTSTHQTILFKYAKVGQNIATNVYTTVLLSWQIPQDITARILSKTAYPVITRSKYGWADGDEGN